MYYLRSCLPKHKSKFLLGWECPTLTLDFFQAAPSWRVLSQKQQDLGPDASQNTFLAYQICIHYHSSIFGDFPSQNLLEFGTKRFIFTEILKSYFLCPLFKFYFGAHSKTQWMIYRINRGKQRSQSLQKLSLTFYTFSSFHYYQAEVRRPEVSLEDNRLPHSYDVIAEITKCWEGQVNIRGLL